MITVEPIRDEDFDRDTFNEAERKARGGLAEQASLTTIEAQHIACYDKRFAAEALQRRTDAIEQLERQRLVNKATANAEAKRNARYDPPRKNESWDQFIARNPAYPITAAFFDATLRGVLEALKETREKDRARIKQLEDRVAELASDKGLQFRGDWSHTETYEPNDICHNAGSAWVATMKSTGVKPSTGDYSSMCWQLFVSRGRPGRNAPESR